MNTTLEQVQNRSAYFGLKVFLIAVSRVNCIGNDKKWEKYKQILTVSIYYFFQKRYLKQFSD